MRSSAVRRGLACLLIPIGCAGPWQGSLSGSKPITFSGLSAREAVSRHCSRPSPESDGSWQPSASCTVDLDRALSAVIASLPSGARPPDAVYSRQYAPFTYRGSRYVYVNVFKQDEGQQPWLEPAPSRADGPIDVCDGGNAFFALNYDVARAAFVSYETNGPDRNSLELDARVAADCAGTGDATWVDACRARERELAVETAPPEDDPCSWYCPTLAEVLRDADLERLERRLLRLSRCFENQCARAEVRAHLGAVRVSLGKLQIARGDFAAATDYCTRAFDAQQPAFQNEAVKRELCGVMRELQRPHFGYCRTAPSP